MNESFASFVYGILTGLVIGIVLSIVVSEITKDARIKTVERQIIIERMQRQIKELSPTP